MRPPKLAGLLATQGNDGKPLITPEQRAYFDGLNDHLKALLSNAAETEIITRADHLGCHSRRWGCVRKRWKSFCRTIASCATRIPKSKSRRRSFLSPTGSNAAPHLNLRDLVDDVHFRRELSCAGCHGGDPANAKIEHTFVKEWPGTGRDKDRSWILPFARAAIPTRRL